MTSVNVLKKATFLWLSIAVLLINISSASDMGSDVLTISNQRQLFVDNLVIESMPGLRLIMHEPVPQNIILYLNEPWEGNASWCPIVMHDGDVYRLWYRADDSAQYKKSKKERYNFTAYAESKDGIHWQKPSLGLFEFNGSKNNNICISDGDVRHACVFKDGNPDANDDQRYKALGIWGLGPPCRIFGMVSSDGIHWRKIQQEPLIIAPDRDPQFDTHLSVFWDHLQQRYVMYNRGLYPDHEVTGWRTDNAKIIRAIRMTTSKDFIHWQPWQYINIGEKPWQEHLYTSSAHIYYRGPYYLMFPKRFLPTRKFLAEWEYPGLSDVVFLASRDGLNWTRLFREAFLRPGLDENNWHERAIYVARDVVKTGPGEMSMYVLQNYRTDNVHIRRFTLREDGFVSVNAPFEGGEMSTKLLTFTGNRLEINYSTSAAGSLRVELLDQNGKVYPGFSREQCEEIFGDEILRTIKWTQGTDVGSLQGKPVRCRFIMKDADLYSFKFYQENPK